MKYTVISAAIAALFATSVWASGNHGPQVTGGSSSAASVNAGSAIVAGGSAVAGPGAGIAGTLFVGGANTAATATAGVCGTCSAAGATHSVDAFGVQISGSAGNASTGGEFGISGWAEGQAQAGASRELSVHNTPVAGEGTSVEAYSGAGVGLGGSTSSGPGLGLSGVLTGAHASGSANVAACPGGECGPGATVIGNTTSLVGGGVVAGSLGNASASGEYGIEDYNWVVGEAARYTGNGGGTINPPGSGGDGGNGGGSDCNAGGGNGSEGCDPGNSGNTPGGGVDDD